VTSTVELLGFCCDAVARAPVQNFVQFNGFLDAVGVRIVGRG